MPAFFIFPPNNRIRKSVFSETCSMVIFWFRRDLRLFDNAGLYHALKSGKKVMPLFIFDRHILDELQDRNDKRVEFIYRTISDLKRELSTYGSDLVVKYGTPEQVYAELLETHPPEAVYTNHDYEPYARSRDAGIEKLLSAQGIPLFTYKDQCIFEKSEILNQSGLPYSVFTPYSRKWKECLSDFYSRAYPVEKYVHGFIAHDEICEQDRVFPSLESMGFRSGGLTFPGASVSNELIRNYKDTRNYPATEGTSRLSVHLRFGTISIRSLVTQTLPLGETFLNELIWRDFYMMILWHFPHVINQAFKKEYEHIPWRNNVQEFEKWCSGNTGYPIVDAGMRELNETGYMHNRVRMIAASFLTKHLLVDWRWGEAYFAEKLLDFDLSANNGGWQWAAGCGCDAAPYFRVFNPYEQTRKFDPDLVYIRKWVPGFEDFSYPSPVVDHKLARERAIQTYKKALTSQAPAMGGSKNSSKFSR